MNAVDVLLFMEYLVENSCSESNTNIYISASKSMCAINGCSVVAFSDQRISLFLDYLLLLFLAYFMFIHFR